MCLAIRECYKKHPMTVAATLSTMGSVLIIIGALALHARYAGISNRLKALSMAGAITTLSIGGVLGLMAITSLLCKSCVQKEGESTGTEENKTPPDQESDALKSEESDVPAVFLQEYTVQRKTYELYLFSREKARSIGGKYLQENQFFYCVITDNHQETLSLVSNTGAGGIIIINSIGKVSRDKNNKILVAPKDPSINGEFLEPRLVASFFNSLHAIVFRRCMPLTARMVGLYDY